MNKISSSKIKLLDGLLNIYEKEVEVIYAVSISWEQLKEAAQDRCVEDFDQAIIARETLLEEIANLKNEGISVYEYELALFNIDQHLIDQNSIVREIYGLDVNSFLNIKKPKELPPKVKK